MTRACGACPAWTQAVCRHAFGESWNDRSRCGEGCDNPLDDVAEAWRKAGWTPEDGETKAITLPFPKAPRRPPKMPRRPVRNMTQGDLI